MGLYNVHCLEEGCIGNSSLPGRRDLPSANTLKSPTAGKTNGRKYDFFENFGGGGSF